jgi:hypothetical protein
MLALLNSAVALPAECNAIKHAVSEGVVLNEGGKCIHGIFGAGKWSNPFTYSHKSQGD